MSDPMNIILFGETGVGKSSVINLIAGREVAKTSSDVMGCTLSFTPHSFDVDGQNYHIWDTVGLEEPESGVVGYLAAIEQACDLIHSLADQGGVNLLLFCIRGNRITATVQSNYRLFYEVLCKSQVPVALVITNLERETVLEDWWTRNHESLDKYGIKCAGHACVTGLRKHAKYGESRENIRRLLQGNGSYKRFTMPPEGWFTDFLRLLGLVPSLKKGLKRKDIVQILTKRCRLEKRIAEEVAEKMMTEWNAMG